MHGRVMNRLPLTLAFLILNTLAAGTLQAQSPIPEVPLEDCFLIDSAHGAQAVDGSAPVVVGYPGELVAHFSFQLAPGTQLPSGGLVGAWRSYDQAGNGIAVYLLEVDGGFAPREWNVTRTGSCITVLRYSSSTGSGFARLGIPLGRLRDHELYPSLNRERAGLELRIGTAGTIAVSPDGGSVQGALFSANIEFASTVPEYVVDIMRPRSVEGEPLGAWIYSREIAPFDRVLGLRSTVEGIIEGLPSSVVLPAHQRQVAVAFAPLTEGSYQIEVMEGSMVVGYSTIAEIDPEADLGYHYAVPDGGQAEPFRPDGLGDMPPEEFETTLSPSELTMPTYSSATPQGVDMACEPEQYCKQPARPYSRRNTADICGDCASVPLDEEDKPDCPELLGVYWTHVCATRYSLAHDGIPPTDCNETVETTTLNNFAWTGTRGEYTCASSELTLGEVIVFSLSGGSAKSCCTYQATGESAEYSFPSCVPN